jgi:predicted secreted Zn-dependent protease
LDGIQGAKALPVNDRYREFLDGVRDHMVLHGGGLAYKCSNGL